MRPIIHYRRKGFQPIQSFDPTTIPGETVEFWLDATFGVKQTDDITDAGDGDTVGQWNDRSGNNQNFTTSGSNIKYRASAPAHLEVTAEGSDQLFRATAYGAVNTMFLVIDLDDQKAGLWSLVSHRNNQHYALIGDQGSSSLGDNVTGTPTYQKNVGTSVNNTRNTVYSAYGGSAGLVLATMYYDKWNSTFGFQDGISFFGSGNYDNITGKIYEVILYSGAVSSGNRATIQQALVDKYSIT